ncbi:MAG: tetratricopeptide repeat protein, partial [Leptolyngbyaceae cyanobacterium]
MPRVSSAQIDTPLLEINGTLEAGDAVADDGSLYDDYPFEGEAGQAILIQLESAAFDTYLWLLDAAGNALAQNDDANEGTNSQIGIVLPETGTYRVRANAFDASGQGNYRLNVRLTTADNPSVLKTTANTLLSQGNQQYRISQFRVALETWEQALTLYREIGDRAGEGAALGNLGNAYNNLGQYERAIDLYEQDLAITRDIGDRAGEGSTMGNIGIAYESLGQYERAIALHEQRLAIAREIGERSGEGAAMKNIGKAFKTKGQKERAIEINEQDLAITRDIGD